MKVAMDVKGDNVCKSGIEGSDTESGVMFPRLNVKETKKDGPRAPPRNKMALYEQFTIPSNRFLQPTHAAPPPRQNPTPLINQPVSCDGRFMYAPYYVSPHVYPTVSFPGQFLGQSAMSGTNSTATESDKSSKCDVAKSIEQSARVANYSNARDQKVQCNQNPFSSHMNHVEDSTLQASRKLNNSDVADGMKLGGLHLQKKVQKTSNPMIRCISEDSRIVPLQVGSRLKYPVHQSLNPVIPNDGTEPKEREPKLCKDSTQYRCGDAYCAKEGLHFEKPPNEGVKSRVEYKDSYHCKTKTSSMSDNIATSKGINLCSSISEFRAYVEQSHGAKEPLKTTSACAESQYSVENLSRDLDKDTEVCQKDEQSNEKESLRDQVDSSDHNSDSSMVDSLHAVEITPKTVISAIGQKEFWRVRKAILRQQKIFSTQVFELHRLVKVQKLIATPSNMLIEDNMYKSLPIVISEEQCVPSIDPEKGPKTFAALVHNDSEIAVDKGKPCNKTMPTHSSISSHPSAIGTVELTTHDTRGRSHPDIFTVGTFAAGSASTWGYPAYLQNPCAMPARPGCYGYYQQYPLNQMGVPNAVMGIPCSLEGNSTGSRNVHGCQHQCQCSAEHQGNVLGHFPKYPSRDGLCYNSPAAPVPFEPFGSAGKASYPFFDAERSVGNGSGEEMSAGSFRSESVLKQSKQVTNLSIDKCSNEYHSQDTASQVSVGQDIQGLSQTEHIGLRSKNRNAACHPSASLSEQKMNDTDMQENRFNSLNWRHSDDAHEYECPNPKESNEDVANVPDVAEIKNQALSLFPLSSSFSRFSKTIKDKSLFSTKEPRVLVIKAVPRTATAASESTADILLSLQRERQQ